MGCRGTSKNGLLGVKIRREITAGMAGRPVRFSEEFPHLRRILAHSGRTVSAGFIYEHLLNY
jgi:hypothetical protein